MKRARIVSDAMGIVNRNHQKTQRPGVLAPYRSLFAMPGTSMMVGAGFVGRLPSSMLALGAVLFVSTVTDSYALAGAVSAVIMVARSIASPFVGSFSDRRGQNAVLIVSIILHTIGVVSLTVAVFADASFWVLFPAAALTGAAVPQLGPLVRSRWTAMLGGTGKLSTAFSLESVVDEMVFIVGPILATVLATMIWPPAGLIAATFFAVSGSLALIAAPRNTNPDIVIRQPGHATSAMQISGIRILALIFVAVGIIFGTRNVSIVAFAEVEGSKVASGLLVATMAISSLVIGLYYGIVRWKRPMHQRFLLSLVALTLGTIPMSIATSIQWMFLASVVAGISISPIFIGGVSLVETLAPPNVRTEGFAWVSAATGVGLALGSSVAGQIIEAASGHRAFLLCNCAAAIALLIALVGFRSLRPPTAELTRINGVDEVALIPRQPLESEALLPQTTPNSASSLLDKPDVKASQDGTCGDP